ncbi:hypothetical protein EV421DRAFT_1907816 [Armillaria borealis]|uniref:F-box domain-containing protein n=1 Tax=Armillaria borealis TaxID=47425 RepID=A0AA39J7F3_9AGAR|nr:hypothetical protein EV421DRAFT_1907816 [Armillaria borealis]
MVLPELPYDVVAQVMGVSTLETSDLASCSTVSWSWYSTSMQQQLRSITLSQAWDCTYWSDYLERHSIFTGCIREMHIRGHNMQILSFLLNGVLTMCPNLEILLAMHVDLARLQRPINFQCPVEIRLCQCRFCSWGATTLLGYSDVTSLIVVRPSFITQNVAVPVWYGPPQFVPTITVTRTSFSDVIQLFRCLPAYLLVFERVEMDLIPGEPAPPPSTHVVLPSLGPVVRRLLVHTIDMRFPLLAMFFDLSRLTSLQSFIYMSGDLFPTSALHMLQSIPRDAPLHHVTLATATFIDPSWSLVPTSLIGFRRTIEMCVVYGCLPPNRDGLNSLPLVTVTYTTFGAVSVSQYLGYHPDCGRGPWVTVVDLGRCECLQLVHISHVQWNLSTLRKMLRTLSPPRDPYHELSLVVDIHIHNHREQLRAAKEAETKSKGLLDKVLWELLTRGYVGLVALTYTVYRKGSGQQYGAPDFHGIRTGLLGLLLCLQTFPESRCQISWQYLSGSLK